MDFRIEGKKHFSATGNRSLRPCFKTVGGAILTPEELPGPGHGAGPGPKGIHRDNRITGIIAALRDTQG